MLVEEHVEVTWGTHNKQHYLSKGYTFTKIGNPFVVKIEELFPGSTIRINAICSICGITKEMGYFNYMRKGSYTCRKCKTTTPYTYEQALEAFVQRGYTPLFTRDDFKTGASVLKYQCPSHPDEPLSVTLRIFNRLKVGCRFCGYVVTGKAISGSAHCNWKGGVSRLALGLRKYINKWKLGILAAYNYKCYLSGSNQHLQVHHVNKQFSKILEEIMSGSYYDKAKAWGEYTQEELDAIGSKIVEAHDDVSGVPLTKELHKFFHKIYGTKRCTEQDFNQFCRDYWSGALEEDN